MVDSLFARHVGAAVGLCLRPEWQVLSLTWFHPQGSRSHTLTMANELTLMAEPRTVHGKKVGRLRREGLIPGVVYGPVVKETVSVSVNRRDFEKFFKTNGHSAILTLNWDGGSQPVLIREVQVDPVSRVPLHIDFFAPNMLVVLRSSVPVALHNPSEDAKGILQAVLTEIEVEALPSALPHQIDADISDLVEVGDSIHVSDLRAPEGVSFITHAEELVASIVAQAVEEEPEAAETAEEAAVPEGEAEGERTKAPVED